MKAEDQFDYIITAQSPQRQYWLDLWKYRELFYFLAWKDILVRYKQTVLGISWSILRPLLTMLALVFVFNKVAKIDSGNTPYAILVFAGILPWQLFSTALADSSSSLITNSNLISKVYFPRVIIPSSTILVCTLDFLISLAILALLFVYYSYIPSINILFLPILIILTMILSLGLGLLFSALNVKYRDFRYIIPFILQFGIYVSPVGFTTETIPEKWKLIYSLNPLVGIIDGFRWSILQTQNPFPNQSFSISIFISAILFIFGVSYFRKTERGFADTI